MKFAFGAAIAAFAILAVSPALAQSACPPAPAAQPAVPDGAVAKKSEMQAADKAINVWYAGMKAHMDCERSGIEALKAGPDVTAFNDAVAKLKAVQDAPGVKDYQAKVEAYNAEAAKMNAYQETWKKSTESFNAKTGAKPN
jgi:hypothetical protein